MSTASRTNLGLLQKDSNVIYDLATHDFSIMDYLFNTDAPDNLGQRNFA